MSRAWRLGLFLARDLFRSLLGVLPPALTVGLYAVAFYYAASGLDYFVSMGGFCLAAVCLVTTLLLCDRVNRATTYPLLARLPHRWELLAGVLVAVLLVTMAMAGLLTAAALAQGRVALNLASALLVWLWWLPVFGLTATIGLHMSKLVSRGASYLVAYGALGLLLTMRDEQRALLRGDFAWLIDAGAMVVQPITTLLTAGESLFDLTRHLPALCLTIAYGALLFWGAVRLFERKDLVWAE